MLALILRTIKDRWLSLVIYIAICAVLVWMFVAIYPSFSQQAAEFSQVFEHYPEAFMEAFDVEIGSMLSSMEGFLAAEQYSIMWPIVAIILAISLGSGAFAGEIEQGTIEILLSQPLSRSRIFWAKYISGLIIISLFTIFSVATVFVFAALYNVNLDSMAHFWVGVLGWLFVTAIYAVTIMFSSIFSSKSKPSSLVAGILLFMYAVDLISSLKESVENLKFLSFFYYFDHNAALLDHHIEWLAIGVFLGVTLICTFAGLVIFKKRDIAV